MGLKRPSTAIGSSSKAAATSRPATSMLSSIASKVGSKIKAEMTKPTTASIKRMAPPTGPVSAEKDEIDEIYKAEDPIESSIAIR